MRKLAGLTLALAIAAGFSTPGADGAEFRIGFHRQVFGSFDVVASKKGWFDQELGRGNYSLNPFAQGKRMVEALLSNSLDVGIAGDIPYVDAIGQGARMTAIGVNSWICKVFTIMVRPDSPIRRVADLKGKRYGEAKGSGTMFTFEQKILPAHGLTIQDVTVVNLLTTDRVAALRARQVDAILGIAPFSLVAEEEGTARIIETFCKYEDPPFPLVANPRTLKAAPELYVKYLRAWLKAQDLFKKDANQFARIYHEYLLAQGSKPSFRIILRSVQTMEVHPQIDERFYKRVEFLAATEMKEGRIRRIPDFRGGEGTDVGPMKKAMAGLN